MEERGTYSPASFDRTLLFLRVCPWKIKGLIPPHPLTLLFDLLVSLQSLPVEVAARTKVSIPPEIEAPTFYGQGDGKSTLNIALRRVSGGCCCCCFVLRTRRWEIYAKHCSQKGQRWLLLLLFYGQSDGKSTLNIALRRMSGGCCCCCCCCCTDKTMGNSP